MSYTSLYNCRERLYMDVIPGAYRADSEQVFNMALEESLTSIRRISKRYGVP